MSGLKTLKSSVRFRPRRRARRARALFSACGSILSVYWSVCFVWRKEALAEAGRRQLQCAHSRPQSSLVATVLLICQGPSMDFLGSPTCERDGGVLYSNVLLDPLSVIKVSYVALFRYRGGMGLITTCSASLLLLLILQYRHHVRTSQTSELEDLCTFRMNVTARNFRRKLFKISSCLPICSWLEQHISQFVKTPHNEIVALGR